jgi:hypothetical protein
MTKSIASKCDVRGGVHSTITMTDGTPPWWTPRQGEPERWTGNAWTVELRYQGRTMTVPFFTGSLAGEPTTADVLDCLLSDSLSPESFSDFCAEFGYDEDSRRAEQTHKACLDMGRRVRQLLGSDFDTFAYDLERL